MLCLPHGCGWRVLRVRHVLTHPFQPPPLLLLPVLQARQALSNQSKERLAELEAEHRELQQQHMSLQ